MFSDFLRLELRLQVPLRRRKRVGGRGDQVSNSVGSLIWQATRRTVGNSGHTDRWTDEKTASVRSFSAGKNNTTVVKSLLRALRGDWVSLRKGATFMRHHIESACWPPSYLTDTLSVEAGKCGSLPIENFIEKAAVVHELMDP